MECTLGYERTGLALRLWTLRSRQTKRSTGPNFMSAPGSTQLTGREDMSEQNKAIVRRFLEDIRNAGDLDMVDELCAPHYLDKTFMLFGDAKAFANNIVHELNAAK